MANNLFLWAQPGSGVTLKIGSREHGRSVHLTYDEACDLAYRLMSLGKGGETRGFEKFEGKR